jgi:hypothetical protein
VGVLSMAARAEEEMRKRCEMRTLLSSLLVVAFLMSACGGENTTVTQVPATASAAPSPTAKPIHTPAPAMASAVPSPTAKQTDTPLPATATRLPSPTPRPPDTPIAEPTEAVDEGEGLAALNELDDGWNMLVPGGDTICSDGSEYAFFVRPADTKKLLIYFEGGGACWFGEICDLSGNPTYDPVVGVYDSPGEHLDGIFDLENPENPFADYSMVFVPYCTADVHMGNRVTTYEVPAKGDVAAHEVTIHHKGYVNATAVLDWTFENLKAPETVFVTGDSAGSIASPFYTAFVAERYPDAFIAQLGDAAGGYRTDAVPAVFANWGTIDILPDFPEFQDATVDNLTVEAFYLASASRYPDITFAQVNTAADGTQRGFLNLMGADDTPLLERLKANFADLNAAVDNFRSYTAGGAEHSVLGRSQFYTYQVDGLLLRDWVAALAAGEDVEDVMCTDCESAE